LETWDNESNAKKYAEVIRMVISLNFFNIKGHAMRTLEKYGGHCQANTPYTRTCKHPIHTPNNTLTPTK
jgi:hypothetical protein